MTLQQMGRGIETLPFDWLRVSHEGLLHFLHRGFEAPIREGLGAGGQRPSEMYGLLDFATRKRVPGTALTMCRSHLHSFWHDDIGDPEARAKLDRRIDSWNMLGKKGETLLFVRAVASTAELRRADEVLSALTRKFGPQACLLMIADFQTTNVGAFVVEGIDDLLVYFLGGAAHQGANAQAPYIKPITCALHWVKGEELAASCIADLDMLQSIANPTNWGLAGPRGMRAFEGAAKPVSEVATPSAAALAENAWLEEAKLEATKDSFALVSLGCHPGLAQALDTLGVAAEEGPFDGVRIRLDGVMHFLLTDFRDFFDVTSTQQVPGTSMMLRRSSFHCFCDTFKPDAWQQAYRRGIDNFAQLVRSSRPKLFVYAVADTQELESITMLLEELMAYFGRLIYLAVIVGGQPEPRLVSINGNDHILVHFISEDVPMNASDPYCQSIKRSLDWAVGRAMKAAVVPDVSALRSLAKPAQVCLIGPGGLQPFDEVANFSADAAASPLLGGSTASSAESALSLSEVKAGFAFAPEQRSPVRGALNHLFKLS